ncbi:MAG: glutamate-5-semialdehyde dehydrogenase [Campylobacteraceae bacterium]|jgi:glutamate-5-semialdehyde dehydrogenase|nr:glutamate-5-semialdehyde dehydrogenase [Campylobacteraceae bacterium]
MEQFLIKAKKAARAIANLKPSFKTAVLSEFAKAIRDFAPSIIEANELDLKQAEENNLNYPLKERLTLNEKRVEDMAKAVEEIAALRDPIGRILDGWVVPNGLKIEKVAVPIGVVGIIYESRPNVTSDTAALCFKSGNICVLKGGKEAERSNKAIVAALQKTLQKFNLPIEAVSLLPDSSRQGVAQFIKMDKYVDVIVPRGGESLIKFVTENSSIPVIKHDKGVCHTYIDSEADLIKAVNIAVNAKCSKPSACNALETLLIHKDIAQRVLPELYLAFTKTNTELRGCENTAKIIKVKHAAQDDYGREYLDNILSIKIVNGLEEAIEHITKYGSLHSEAIITENYTKAEKFMQDIDAACVYLNASSRFTDGGEFGFGAEVGISTNRLHARGPMGINELTTYKYKVYGEGQIRS